MKNESLEHAENQFIKSLYLDPAKWADLGESAENILNCFDDQGMRQVAEALLGASAASDPDFAIITALDRIDELKTAFPEIGEKVEIALNSSSAIDLKQATDQLKNRASVSQLIRKMERLRSDPKNGLYWIEQIQASTTDILGRFQKRSRPNVMSGKELALMYHEAVQKEFDNFGDGGEIPGVIFDIRKLDKILKGMRPSELCIIAGRPSAGKSSLLYQAIYQASHIRKMPSLVVNMELSVQEQAARFAANHRTIGQSVATTVSELKFDQDNFSKLSQSVEALAEAPMFIVEDTSLTIDDIEREVRYQKTNNDIELLAVDYLTLIPSLPNERQDHSFYTKIANRLKAIAKKYNILVISCAQLNRESPKEKRPPKMQDLRESGGIEQAADKILGVWRRENTKEEVANGGNEFMRFDNGRYWSRINIMKNRQGESGHIIDVEYDGINGKFYEMQHYENA